MLRDSTEITKENAKECATAYLAGELAVKRGSKANFKNKSKLYRTCYQIGKRDQLATQKNRDLDLSEFAIQLRECVAGFRSGRRQANKGLAYSEKYKSSKSASYNFGYNSGYSSSTIFTKMLDEYGTGYKRKQPEESVAEVREIPAPKKARVEDRLFKLSIFYPAHSLPAIPAKDITAATSALLDLGRLPVPGRD